MHHTHAHYTSTLLTLAFLASVAAARAAADHGHQDQERRHTCVASGLVSTFWHRHVCMLRFKHLVAASWLEAAACNALHVHEWKSVKVLSSTPNLSIRAKQSATHSTELCHAAETQPLVDSSRCFDHACTDVSGLCSLQRDSSLARRRTATTSRCDWLCMRCLAEPGCTAQQLSQLA